MKSKKYIILAVYAASALTFATANPGLDRKRNEKMDTTASLATELFSKVKTVCFGRLLMEVPATATVIYGPTNAPLPVAYFADGAKDIEKHLSASLVEVEKRRMLLDPAATPLPLFGKIVPGTSPGQRLVYGSKRRGVYAIESYVPVGRDLFVQYVDVASRYDEMMKELNDFAGKVELRSSDGPPADIGFCIEGGFVPGDNEFEGISLGIRLAEYPDVHFSVTTMRNGDYIDEHDNLESHIARANSEWTAWAARVKFLRKAPRQLGAWKGYEALGRVPPHDQAKEAHEFHFISVGEKNSSLQPRLDVQMNTGASASKAAAVRPSVSDEDAVAIWDRLIGSIRVRPTTSDTKKPARTADPTENMQKTGATCSQTGWWKCADDGNVEGGRKRFFEQGQTLPPVALESERSIWNSFSFSKDKHVVETVWTFVGHS